MANIGNATLVITPKFNGLVSSINSELQGADIGQGSRALGDQISSGVATGFGKAGAVMGVFSSVASRAMSAVTSHVGSAVSRLDTLKNYPRVMQSLGVSAEEAQGSIGTMSDRLQSLPTRLDDMAQTVQGIYAASKMYGVSLTEATDAGLALNSMLLAGGQSQATVNAAMEQFRQMLSKGKPDMQDWRSLMSAAPGQMDQLAKSMLGASAQANDLYYALGGGKEKDEHLEGIEWASISMDQLLAHLVEMGPQFASAAEDATGGIATSLSNMGNAVTRGLADVLDNVGTERIVGVINTVKGGIKGAFQGVNDIVNEFGADNIASGIESALSAVGDVASMILPVAKTAVPVVKDMLGAVSAFAPALITAKLGAEAFSGGIGLITKLGTPIAGVVGAVQNVGAAVSGLAAGANLATKASTALTTLGLSPMALGAGAAVAGVGVLAVALHAAWEKSERERISSEGLGEALQGLLAPLDDVSAGFDASAEARERSAGRVRTAMDALNEAHENTVDVGVRAAEAVRQADAAYRDEAYRLEHAGSVIDAYNGAHDLSASQLAEFTGAVEQVNSILGTQFEVLEQGGDYWLAESGNIQQSTDKLWENIHAREALAKAEALMTAKQQTDEKMAALANERAAAMEALDAAAEQVQLNGGYEAVAERGRSGDAYHPQDMEALGMLQSFDKAAASMRGADQAYRALAQSSRELSAETAALEARAAGADLSVSQLALTSEVAMQAFGEGGQKASLSAVDFANALQACATDGEALRDALADPAAMARIASAYDGTAASLKGVLSEMGVGFDEMNARALATSGTLEQMGDFISALGDEAYVGMAQMGKDADTLAAALSGAGVSMLDLSAIGGDAFAEMLATCGGDITKLTGMVRLYNETPIMDKNGRVTTETTQLIDAQGQLYTWNGTELLDKDGNVYTDYVELIDALGQVAVWNGSSLQALHGTASVDYSGVLGALSAMRSLAAMNGLTVRGQAVIDVSQRTSGSGGHYTMARGGAVVRHAAGMAIVDNKGPGVGLDAVRHVVGEDGGELVVPLTNRKYSQPFADVIAESVVKSMPAQGPALALGSLTVNDPSVMDLRVRDFIEYLVMIGGA